MKNLQLLPLFALYAASALASTQPVEKPLLLKADFSADPAPLSDDQRTTLVDLQKALKEKADQHLISSSDQKSSTN